MSGGKRNTHAEIYNREDTKDWGLCCINTCVSYFSKFLDLNTLDILNRKSKREEIPAAGLCSNTNTHKLYSGETDEGTHCNLVV